MVTVVSVAVAVSVVTVVTGAGEGGTSSRMTGGGTVGRGSSCWTTTMTGGAGRADSANAGELVTDKVATPNNSGRNAGTVSSPVSRMSRTRPEARARSVRAVMAAR